MFRYSLIMLCACMLLVACDEAQDKVSGTVARQPADTLRYHSVQYVDSYEDCDTLAEHCTWAEIRYPYFEAKDIGTHADSLNALVQEPLLTADFSESAEQARGFADIITGFIRDYRDFRADKPDMHIAWQMSNKAGIVNNRPDVLCVRYFNTWYMGGAHPNSSVSYRNLDPRAPRLLQPADILEAGAGERLRSLAEQHFRTYHNLKADADLAESGFMFENGRFALNDNIGLLSDGLAIHFNPYEIAAYAVGSTELRIPYAELQGIVQARYLPKDMQNM